MPRSLTHSAPSPPGSAMTTMTTLEPEAPVGADQAPPGPQPAPRAVDRNPFDQDLFLQDGSDQSHAFGPHFGLRTVLRGGGAPTVVVTGELDLASGPGLAEILCAALEEHPEGVHVDLGDVSFCDGTGLRALLIAQA